MSDVIDFGKNNDENITTLNRWLQKYSNSKLRDLVYARALLRRMPHLSNTSNVNTTYQYFRGCFLAIIATKFDRGDLNVNGSSEIVVSMMKLLFANDDWELIDRDLNIYSIYQSMDKLIDHPLFHGEIRWGDGGNDLTLVQLKQRLPRFTTLVDWALSVEKGGLRDDGVWSAFLEIAEIDEVISMDGIEAVAGEINKILDKYGVSEDLFQIYKDNKTGQDALLPFENGNNAEMAFDDLPEEYGLNVKAFSPAEIRKSLARDGVNASALNQQAMTILLNLQAEVNILEVNETLSQSAKIHFKNDINVLIEIHKMLAQYLPTGAADNDTDLKTISEKLQQLGKNFIRIGKGLEDAGTLGMATVLIPSAIILSTFVPAVAPATMMALGAGSVIGKANIQFGNNNKIINKNKK